MLDEDHGGSISPEEFKFATCALILAEFSFLICIQALQALSLK